jgi:hypothetical protein
MRILDGWTTGNRAALAVLAASVVVCASAARGAGRVAPLPERPAPRTAPAMPDVQARTPAASDAQILRAVSRDPFRPDRRRPPGRYRMPGAEPVIDDTPTFDYTFTPPAAAVPRLTLTGTVVLANGTGLAAVAGPGGESRLMRAGDEMDGFRVVRVTNGSVTLSNGDTTLVLKTQGGAP